LTKQTYERLSGLSSISLKIVAAIAEAEIKKHIGL